jgi:imidazolonepropionase-like amidohydrolase
MRLFCALIVATVLVTGCTTSKREPIDLLVANARVITGTGVVLNRASILIDDGRIVAVRPGNPTDRAARRTVDLTGRTVLPGLIDTHVHLLLGDATSPGYLMSQSAGTGPPLSQEALSAYLEKTLPPRLQSYLSRGITTVASTGDYFPAILQVRQQTTTDPRVGPRVLVVGPVVCTTDGHPARTVCGGNRWCAERLAREVRTVAGVEAVVRELAEAKVDMIKMVHDSGLRSPLALELIDAVVRSAHDRGLWAVVHAGSVSEAGEALRAGADRLVHPPALDTIQSEELATLLKPHGVSVASTLAISSVSDRHEESQGRRPRVLANVLANVRLLRRSGVGVAFGTDVPMLSVGDAMDLELDLLREAGFSSSEIVQIVTKNAAAYLGILDKVGTVEPGKIADLLVVRGDPIEDLRTLRDVQLVLRDGQVVFTSESNQTP